ncbi:MAG: ABC transporter permease [Lachnospiraceae bacterium]
MRILDLLRMSCSSLWKRKFRTFLTVLGVIVGTASIVVMISLGLGLNKSSMDQIEKYGGLTTITVTESSSNGSQGGGMKATATAAIGGAEDSASKKKKRLDDAAVEEIKKVPGASTVSPVLSLHVIARRGSYEAGLNLQGMTIEALQQKKLVLKEGRLPEANAGKLELVYGNMVLVDFSNPKTGENYWSNGKVADIDLMNDPLFVIFDSDAYYQSQTPPTDKKTAPVPPPKKYLIEGCGLLAGEIGDFNNDAWSVYCDIEALELQLKKAFKNKVIPGQPARPSGKPYKELYYNSIYVNVDDMKQLESVQSAIMELGYQADSNADWAKSTKEQFGYIQLVLGGIGAVSLLVAAIGITNTMMMSIYERTKEIGVMKVLGCDMRNIQTLFLAEAGFIGLVGGIAGIILSYGISVIINFFVKQSGSEMSSLSLIPPWLALFAVLFAIVVGMVAGFFPSLRAMKLSPLAAIRNE